MDQDICWVDTSDQLEGPMTSIEMVCKNLYIPLVPFIPAGHLFDMHPTAVLRKMPEEFLHQNWGTKNSGQDLDDPLGEPMTL